MDRLTAMPANKLPIPNVEDDVRCAKITCARRYGSAVLLGGAVIRHNPGIDKPECCKHFGSFAAVAVAINPSVDADAQVGQLKCYALSPANCTYYTVCQRKRAEWEHFWCACRVVGCFIRNRVSVRPHSFGFRRKRVQVVQIIDIR